jgi:hypothetical protein
VWLGGLVAGFFGLLAAVATYGCADSDPGLACRTSGSLLGVVVVLAVIAIVTAVTLLSHGRPPRGAALLAGSGLVALVVCFVAARMLLDTV